MTVYYINLVDRKDRDALVRAELDALGLRYERIEAVRDAIPARGCAMSHVRALEAGISSGEEHVIIVEDDFQVEISADAVKRALASYATTDYDLILLSYHVPVVRLSNFSNGLARVSNGQSACAYMIRQKYIPTLLGKFNESVDRIKADNLNETAIDQHWKSLQGDSGVYSAVPRLAKQRDDFSDIEKKQVSYGGCCFMIILSCRMYEDRRRNQDLNNCPFQYRYFVGDPSVGEPIDDGHTVILNCGDGYEDLSHKTTAALKWVIKTNEQVDYVFKTDDDIRFDFENLYATFSSVALRKLQYAGNVVKCGRHVSKYHFNKCTDSTLECPIQMEEATYCSGGGYFLSASAVRTYLGSKIHSIFEDYNTGRSLNDAGIFPTHLDRFHGKPNDAGFSCYW